jgi:hypothetical protein
MVGAAVGAEAVSISTTAITSSTRVIGCRITAELVGLAESAGWVVSEGLAESAALEELEESAALEESAEPGSRAESAVSVEWVAPGSQAASVV